MSANKFIVYNCGDNLTDADCLQTILQCDLTQKNCITTFCGRLNKKVAVDHRSDSGVVICRVTDKFSAPNVYDFSIKR